MKRVLLIGFEPATVDFSDPALPPGMIVEKIHAGINVAMDDFVERGWQPEICIIDPDETPVSTVERCLASNVYDCVVIGAGNNPLRWWELPQSSRIGLSLDQTDPTNREDWPLLHIWLLEKLEAFHKAFSPRVKVLPTHDAQPGG
jgi:hypothetical protein